MGYSWQIKPKDSMSLPFLTYAPANIIYRTIGQIKDYLRAKGYNAALLTWNTRGGYNGYMIVTHFGNINSDLHLATDVYFDKSNYTIGYPKPASSSVEQTWMFYVYNDGSGIVNQTGSVWNGFAETKTVDGITYWVVKNPSSAHPPIYVTTYDGNIYYHGDVPIIPNWESVRYIEGNDKTWLLTKINNINDGEPVNNVSVQGNIGLASKTEVDVLIDNVLMDMSKVKVTYSIPEATYTYIKLVYKKDEIPVDETDGTVVNLTQSDTETVITDITDTGIYYFMIFTDKSVSEEVSLRFVAQEEEGE